MRKPTTVNTIEELKSVAFDYNAPVFVGPDILISEFISTDDECDKLIEKLEHYHKSVIAFCFSHDGFRVHFLMIDNFVVLKKYGIENVTIMNLKNLLSTLFVLILTLMIGAKRNSIPISVETNLSV